MSVRQPSLKNLRHFIWDFDGTLFDTYPVIIENLQKALAHYGHTADTAEAMRRMLETIPAARDHYADEFGISRAELAEEYMKYHLQANRELKAQPIAGVKEVLRRIREMGHYNYIFTHRALDETMAYLCKYGLAEEFCEVVAPETPGFALKPAPGAVLYLKEKYGMTDTDAVMVGDREIDLGSGRAAGIYTAHLVCALAPEQLACTWRLKSFEEMLALL